VVDNSRMSNRVVIVNFFDIIYSFKLIYA